MTTTYGEHRDYASSPIIIDKIIKRETTTGKTVLDLFLQPGKFAVMSVFESDYGKLIGAGIPVKEVVESGEPHFCQILVDWESTEKENKNGNPYKQIISAQSMVDNGNGAIIRRLDRMGQLLAQQNVMMQQMLMLFNGGVIPDGIPMMEETAVAVPINGTANHETAETNSVTEPDMPPPPQGERSEWGAVKKRTNGKQPENEQAMGDFDKLDLWRQATSGAENKFDFESAVNSCFREELTAVADGFGLGSGLDAVEKFRLTYLGENTHAEAFAFFEGYFGAFSGDWNKVGHQTAVEAGKKKLGEVANTAT